MSFKTDRLLALFPEVYASREDGSLLHSVLDALGLELMRGDAAVKELLRSHWVDHAREGGLDGLGALVGVERRLLPGGQPEGDDTYRPLVRGAVRSFVGGGTVEAIKGAVRAAFGLPCDLALFQSQLAGVGGRPTAATLALAAGLEALVSVNEFPPRLEAIHGNAVPTEGGSQLVLAPDFGNWQPQAPRIEWTVTRGNARELSIRRQDLPEVLRGQDTLVVLQGQTLVLSGGTPSEFAAWIGDTEVTGAFPAQSFLPSVPSGESSWVFDARHSGVFDTSTFDAGDSFDAPAFSVRMQWLRRQPLMFDVVVPYFIDAAVQRLVASTGHARRFTVFKSLSHAGIQEVVDHHRAAGVRGMVQYVLRLPGDAVERRPWEDQAASERFSAQLESRLIDTHDASEALAVGAFDSITERHDSDERFAIGGNFNIAVFDSSFGFQ